MVEAAITAAGDAERAFDSISGVRAFEPTIPATSASPVELMLPIETEGRYEYGETLGRGGLGQVRAVFDRALGREVAIKDLLAPDNPVAVARFLSEARLTGQLTHPNVIPVHEIGRHPDGAPYYVMKRVPGDTLGVAMESASSLADRLALLPHFTDVCHAIAFAHERGVIHRDLKPDNVMVSHFGVTIVVDWGLAKALGVDEPERGDSIPAASPAHTLDGEIMGTPMYMSPEQAAGRTAEVDERSDVWSLGAILFELLAGRPVFVADSHRGVLAQVMVGEIPEIRVLEPEAPAGLCAIAEHCLTRDRAKRAGSVSEVLEALDAFRTG